jgi:NifB/MoaA-like Fe-S oxidoreductase
MQDARDDQEYKKLHDALKDEVSQLKNLSQEKHRIQQERIQTAGNQILASSPEIRDEMLAREDQELQDVQTRIDDLNRRYPDVSAGVVTVPSVKKSFKDFMTQ